MILSSMKFSWIIKQIFKVEPEPGQSDGSGSSQIPRLRATPAAEACVREFLTHFVGRWIPMNFLQEVATEKRKL